MPVTTRSRSNSSRGRTSSPTPKVSKSTSQKKNSKSSSKGLSKNTICNKRLPELKELCESCNVSSSGTRPDIVKRLLKHTNNGHMGDAIVIAEVNIPGESSTLSNIKKALIEATNNTNFLVQEIHGRKFIADDEGFSYATAKMDAPEDKHNLAEAEKTIKQLKNQPMQVTSDKEAKWDKVRHRVISTFKREINMADSNDHNIIVEASHLIHYGDSITDASLFEPDGPRKDTNAYERLYGLLPAEVRNLADNPKLIRFLDLYATNIVSKTVNSPELIRRVREKMHDFVKRFREFKNDTSFLCGRNRDTALYHAYNDCLDFMKNMEVPP